MSNVAILRRHKMKSLLLFILLGLLFLSGCSSIPSIAPNQLSSVSFKNNITVVMFCKDMCPPCDTQASILFDLSKEFPKVKFVKVKAYNLLFEPTNETVVEKYNLKWTPTTVLLIDDHEVYRWITLHGAGQIRPILQAASEGRIECTSVGCKIVPKRK